VRGALAGRDRPFGLLVKSAHQMVVTAGDLREAGIRVPLLLAARLYRSVSRGLGSPRHTAKPSAMRKMR